MAFMNATLIIITAFAKTVNVLLFKVLNLISNIFNLQSKF